MALVPCPECKAQVSRSATSCPQCGSPFGGATVMSTPFGAVTPPLTPSKEELLWEGTPSLKALAVQVAATAFFAIVVPILVYTAYAPLRDLVSGASRDAARLVVEN